MVRETEKGIDTELGVSRNITNSREDNYSKTKTISKVKASEISVIWGLKEMIEWKTETKWVVDKWDQKVKAAYEACVFMNGILEVSRTEELRLKGGVLSYDSQWTGKRKWRRKN